MIHSYVYPKFVVRKTMGVGHSSQTRSFAPAATLARLRLRNFCLRKRASFLASPRSAYGITDTHGNDKFGIMFQNIPEGADGGVIGELMGYGESGYNAFF